MFELHHRLYSLQLQCDISFPRLFIFFYSAGNKQQVTPLNLCPLNIVSIFRCPRPPHNPVYARRLDPSVLAFGLSLHRRPYVCILSSSHFIYYNKHTPAQIQLPRLISTLSITLNIDDDHISVREHNHLSHPFLFIVDTDHSQTSRILSTSLSRGESWTLDSSPQS